MATTPPPTRIESFAGTGLTWANNQFNVTSVAASALTAENIDTALGFSPISPDLLGANSGVATLDSSGKLTAAQLPTSSGGAVASVAGKTGVVTLATSDLDDVAYSGLSANQVLRFDGSKWSNYTLPAGNAVTVTGVSSTSAALTVGGSSTAPALTFNPGSVLLSTLAGSVALSQIPAGTNGYVLTTSAGAVAWEALPASSGSTTTSTPANVVTGSGGTQALAFAATGDIAYNFTATTACTFTLTGGTSGQFQRIILTIINPSSGIAAITLPTPTGGWSGGTAPTPSATANVVQQFTFTTFNGGTTTLGNY